ncbi:hypothetical protein [uncultured Thiodictyon sp.]|uniref:hypothetical protein n=1 Tax=uncultured Thiodictyon sp. TaxID=1846217 RepID=UPI0025E71516|nr:hypothetical protein [uncultured Thiodictyon sp.]
MPSRRVPVDLNAGTYFLTLTVQRWYYLFDRHHRRQILADSIRYCREHKGLELNDYVVHAEFDGLHRVSSADGVVSILVSLNQRHEHPPPGGRSPGSGP